MKVRVLAFGIAKELMGTPMIDLEMTGEATVQAVRQQLDGRYPRLGQLASYMVAVNSEYAGDDLNVRDGDEIAIIPPVSGG